MDMLHGLMAEGMTEELKEGIRRAKLPQMIDVPDPEKPGQTQRIRNPEYAPLDTKLLQVAIKFLKDNGVDTPATAERFDSLVGELRDLDLDQVALNRPN
jgi:hypothetical protein